MKNKTNKEFILIVIVTLILLYLCIGFVEFKFNVGDWTVISRIFAVLSFFGINGFAFYNLYIKQ